jgi:nicotinamidase-related amidase
MMSHMCVDTTVRACQDFGFKVILLDDACATPDLNYNGEVIPAEIVHKTYMASLNDVFAKVIKTGEFAFV